MNKVILIGRATTDIELKTTQSNKSVCTFSLAVDKPKREDGADFIRCVGWNSIAELLSKHVSKGDRVGVIGRLQIRQWQDKNGNNRIEYEINVSEVELLGGKRPQQEQPDDDTDLPC